MKTNRKNKHRKVPYILVGLFVVAALGGGLYLYKQTRSTENPYTNVQDIDVPTDSTQSSDTDKTPPASDKTSDEIQPSQTGTISITLLEQSDGYVKASATTTNFTPEQCVYSFKIQDGKPVVREQLNGCGSVSIPQAEFDRIGVYKLTVTAYAGDSKVTTSQEIDVQ